MECRLYYLYVLIRTIKISPRYCYCPLYLDPPLGALTAYKLKTMSRNSKKNYTIQIITRVIMKKIMLIKYSSVFSVSSKMSNESTYIEMSSWCPSPISWLLQSLISPVTPQFSFSFDWHSLFLLVVFPQRKKAP